MSILAVIGLVLLQIVVQPAPPAPSPPGPGIDTTVEAAPVPQPGAPAPAAQSQAQAQTTPSIKADWFGDLLYDSGGHAGTRFARDAFGGLDIVWGIPEILAASRTRAAIVDHPRAAQLNDFMTAALMAGLVALGVALVLMVNAVSVLAGREPNPMAAVFSIVAVSLAGLAGMHNRWLQIFPVDLVGIILSTISMAPLRDFAAPGMVVSTLIHPAIGAVHAIAYWIVLSGLTVILFMETMWCVLLGAGAGLWLVGSAMPFFDQPSQYIMRRWMGSLFSPVIVFMAIRLAAPTTSELSANGAPDIGIQLMSIGFLLIAWQAPGFMVGAISVSFPGVGAAYFAGRLMGAGRITERMIPRGGGGGSGSAGGNIASWNPVPASSLPSSGRAATDKPS